MSGQDEAAKRNTFEELDKDELIKKCKGLLSIAQKAKQAKADLQSEIESYKLQLEKCDSEKNTYKENVKTLQELVDSLTEQKLNYITELDAAQNKVKSFSTKCKTLEEKVNKHENELAVKDHKHADLLVKLSTMDTEMISLKRQNTRLVEENEQLLSQLAELESQIVEFNKIGLEQQQQLQKIEAQVGSGDSADNLEKIEELKNKLMELEKTLQITQQENKNYVTSINTAEDKIKEITEMYSKEKEGKEKLNLKLKSYKDKILKCAQCITQLKNSRYILTKTVKDYSESIPKWQSEIIKASKYLDQQINQMSQENSSLKVKLNELEKQITEFTVPQDKDKLSSLQQKVTELSGRNTDLQSSISSLKSVNEELNISQSNLLTENKLTREQLKSANAQINEINDVNNTLNNTVNRLQNENRDLLKKLEQKSTSESTQKHEHLLLQIKALESEKATLVKEKCNGKDQLQELESSNHQLNDKLNKLRSDILKMQQKCEELEQERDILRNKMKSKKQEEANKSNSELVTLKEQFELLKKEYDNTLDLNGLLKEEVETLKLSLEQPKDDEQLSDLNVSLQADIVKLETKLAAYKQENASLLAEMKESRVKTKEAEAMILELEEAKSKMVAYKTENTELLNEMKEINQVLKERGEAISKLQKAVAEMEGLIDTLEKDRDDVNREKEELLKKIAKAEEISKDNKVNAQQALDERNVSIKKLEESEALIASLRDEIDKLKQHQMTSADLPNEDMSTSTISKAEEHSRMKDLDESFEEKYGKLRIFALKLKKKLNETMSQLQNAEQDKTRLEKLLNEQQSMVKTVDSVDGHAPAVSKDEVNELERKIQTLNKALEGTTVTANEVEKLKAELAALSQQLTAEVASHKVTKENLEKARRESKKKSVLSLEMEDYERSMKELTTKMEENKKKIVQMESTIDNQEGTIRAMKTQIKLLEEQIKTEETQSRLFKEELQQVIQSSKDKDEIIQSKNDLISKLEKDVENEKRKSEDSNLETTALLTEKEKVIMVLGEEKADLNNKLKKVEFTCADLREKLKITNIELEDLKTEYSSYKVRAQAVLRQNQTVDHSQEEQMKEEVAALKAQIEELTVKFNASNDQCTEVRAAAEGERRRASEATAEAARASQRTARLQADLNKLAAQLDSERSHHKVQISTLTQCYKTQISDLETRLQRETEELKKQLTAAQEQMTSQRNLDAANRNQQYMLQVIPKEDSDGEMDINVSMLPREEGEGSESAPSPPLSKSFLTAGSRRSPVPLDRLLEEGVPEDEPLLDASVLALSPEQEAADLRRKLTAQQQRVKHVTVLLAECERECARLSQLNDLLKAEVRRARGSIERTQHAHNAEYMKNVTMKFLTLPAGDERERLVPVLQKILTLTSEETANLHAVAKGIDPNSSRGWGSYLPWPGGK